MTYTQLYLLQWEGSSEGLAGEGAHNPPNSASWSWRWSLGQSLVVEVVRFLVVEVVSLGHSSVVEVVCLLVEVVSLGQSLVVEVVCFLVVEVVWWSFLWQTLMHFH